MIFTFTMEDAKSEVIFDCDWWNAIDDDDFRFKFRMSRKTTIALQAELDDMDNIENENTDVYLLFCLWILGNTQTFEEAASMFAIETDIDPVLIQYLTKITRLGEVYLEWPDEQEADKIEDGFAKTYNFPGVIGVIGSLHINISPDGSKHLYYNSEMKKHTIVLQVVCDNQLLLRDVCAGCPGGTNIQNILKYSPLYQKLTDEDDYLVKKNKHLLGGTEHPQMKTLLTPYKGTKLTERQTKFNALHNSVMYTVEKTFSCLENRFPRLTCLENLNAQLATLLVSAACVLHNFTRVRRDF